MSERLDTQYEEKQHQLGEVRQKLKAQAMQITRATREMEANVGLTKEEGGDLIDWPCNHF